MPTLDAYRIINISYDHGKKRMDDLTIELDGRHSIVIIPNGCGKTYSITLLLQTILPGSSLGSRKFEESFADVKGTGHIITAFRLNDTESTLFTGFTVNTEGNLRSFNWCLEYPNTVDIRKLPLVTDHLSLSYDETRDWLKSLTFERKVHLFNQGEGKKLSAHLKTYGIFTDEWEMMCRMNQNEGGIKEIFNTKSRKSTDDLLSEFIIPSLKRELKGVEEVDQVQTSFLKKIDTLKKIPKWEEEIRKMDAYLSVYHTQLEKLKSLYDHEEAFRVELYILKLLNEKSVEKLNCLKKELKQQQLKIAAEREGIKKLLLRGQKLTFANALYQIEGIEHRRREIQDRLDDDENKVKTLEDTQRLNLAIDELEKYNAEQARYEVLQRQLAARKEESVHLKRDIDIIESKLHGYYTHAIQKKEGELTSNTELTEAAEVEKEAIIIGISRLDEQKTAAEREQAVLKQVEREVEKLGGFTALELSQLKIDENKRLAVETAEAFSQTSEQLEHEKEQLSELEKEEFIIKEGVKAEKAKLDQFNHQKDRLDQILRLFHQTKPDALFDHLKTLEDDLRGQTLSNKSERSKTEEIVEYCQHFDTLPPNAEIRKLSSQLKNAGFQDFIPGFEYLRENSHTQNQLLAYGLICENIKGLSAALKKADRPDWPVLVFSRSQIDSKHTFTEKGLINAPMLMIETDALSQASGSLRIDDFIEKKRKQIERLTLKIQGQTDKLSEIEMYRKITEQFIDQYGIDIPLTRHALKESFNHINQRWNGCSDRIQKVEISLIEKRDELKELTRVKKTIEKETRHHLAIIEQFELLHKKCFHIVQSLEAIPERLSLFEKDINTMMIDRGDEQLKLKKQREYLSRLARKGRELMEELGVLKQKKKLYRDNSSKSNLFLYAGEAVEGLEEKLAALKLKFDDNQLIEEGTRTLNQINRTRERISHYGYTIEELQLIDRSKIPSYDACNWQMKQIREAIGKGQNQLGECKALQGQLISRCRSIELSEAEKEALSPLNTEQFERLTNQNTQNIKRLKRRLTKNEWELEQVRQKTHESEILTETQNAFLFVYQIPEKIHIRELNPQLFIIGEREAWEGKKADFLKIKKALENDKRIVENGWTEIKRATGSEQFEMNLSMAMVMEGEGGNILFDYPKIRTLFEQDQTLIQNAREMLKKNIAMNKQEMDTLVENAYRSVECYINEFNNLSKFSNITTHGKRDRSVKFIFPDLSREVKVQNLQQYIAEILKQINQIEEERIATFVRKNFDIKRLIEEIHKKKTVLKVYKPSTTAGWHYEDWDNVIKWSGGEQFFAFFLIYASMSIWIRQKRTRSNRNKTVLIADNPFGQAISEHIFNPLLEFMTDNKIQFLTFTAIKDRETLALFPNKYSLVLQENHDKSSLRIQPGFFMEDL